MKEKRVLKGHSVDEVGKMTHVSPAVVRKVEQGGMHCLDFCVWVGLASYYGKCMLAVPFVISKMEYYIAETYFMYTRNGESVQYSAKQAFRHITGEV